MWIDDSTDGVHVNAERQPNDRPRDRVQGTHQARPEQPARRYLDPNESVGHRFWSRMKREPLIPAGALLTAFVFCGIVYHSNNRNTRQVQLWMRYRVAAQGLTVCAVVLGMYRLQQDTLEYNKKVENIRGQLEDADKVAKQRAEFEERMREAEEAHEAEQGLRNRWRKGKEEKPALRRGSVVEAMVPLSVLVEL
ncbi:hypothetical protein CPB85DRAFT_1451975 [Mucidula mucida]|nr:hypothetical protein CPB85DRAFT_1451975 [Mucidula mucida]